MTRATHVPGAFAEPYARYRRSSHPTPLARSSAIEAALGDLERALCRDRCHAVVDAAPGSGKSLLVRALGERLAGSYQVVHLPSGIGDDEVCARILSSLGESPGRDPEVRLLSVLYEIGSRGSALVLLVDGAGTLSPEALRRLGRLAAVARPDLRLALFVTSRSGGESIRRVIGALGVGAEKIVLQSRVEKAGRVTRPLPPPEPPASTEKPAPRRQEEKALEPFRVTARPAPSRSMRRRRATRLLLGGALAALTLYPMLPPQPAEPQPAPAVSAERGVGPADLAPAPVEAAPVPREPQAAAAAAEDAAGPAQAVPATARSEAAADAAAGEEAASQPPPATIPVSLNARPWARIEVDGRHVGVTPLANLPLTPGRHHFRAHLPDGRILERTAQVDAYRDHVVFP